MKDAGCRSTGVINNHKDFIAKSLESFVGHEHQTHLKNQIPRPHNHVHRVRSKDVDEVFGKTNP